MRYTEGERTYYFNKLWTYWSKECSSGNITESEMENKIDKYENMSTQSLHNNCKRIFNNGSKTMKLINPVKKNDVYAQFENRD